MLDTNHQAVSFAGLWYLSLFLCAKFDVSTPNIPGNDRYYHSHESSERLVADGDFAPNQVPSLNPVVKPAYLLLLPYIPFGLAIFIAGTRYFDFTNHGFDVLAGTAIGTCTARLGFRWYIPQLAGHLKFISGPGRYGRALHSSDDQDDQS